MGCGRLEGISTFFVLLGDHPSPYFGMWSPARGGEGGWCWNKKKWPDLWRVRREMGVWESGSTVAEAYSPSFRELDFQYPSAHKP